MSNKEKTTRRRLRRALLTIPHAEAQRREGRKGRYKEEDREEKVIVSQIIVNKMSLGSKTIIPRITTLSSPFAFLAPLRPLREVFFYTPAARAKALAHF